MSGTPRKRTAPVEKPTGTSSRKRQRTSLRWAKLLEAKIDDGDLLEVVRCLSGLGVDSCKTLGKIPLHVSLSDALGSLEAEKRCVLIKQIEEALNEEEEEEETLEEEEQEQRLIPTPPQPPTLGSRIDEYLLAPSRVKETEVVAVACYLFGEAFASPSEVKHSLQQRVVPAAVDSQHAAAEDHRYHLVLADTFTWTHNVSEEEPPGYLPLGLLVVFFGKMLSRALQKTYKCHPQRSVARNDKPGQNPSTDVAIILRVKSGREEASYISKVLYEYKPSVNNLLDFVESKHLMELFLQCYYVLKFENQTELLGCLTDLHCWHYFGLTRNNSKLKVTFYSRLDMTLPPEQTELASHVSFLKTCLY